MEYLSYWKPRTADRELVRVPNLLDHAASAQYDRVAPGDVLWIVTVWPGSRLALLGPLEVGEVVGQERARRLLGSTDLWDAPYHALAARGTAVPARDVDITSIAGRLRFESPSGRDRLNVADGPRVHANQLQAMRRLTAKTAALLRARWAASTPTPVRGREHEDGGGAEPQPPGGGFGDPETNRAVERAAVAAVTTALAADGWRVASVEAERCGYDLHCTRRMSHRPEELHVEVKGTQGGEPAFVLTAGELARARADRAFVLVVVVDALGPGHQLLRYAGAEVETAFDLTALSYRARPARGTRG